MSAKQRLKAERSLLIAKLGGNHLLQTFVLSVRKNDYIFKMVFNYI